MLPFKNSFKYSEEKLPGFLLIRGMSSFWFRREKGAVQRRHVRGGAEPSQKGQNESGVFSDKINVRL